MTVAQLVLHYESLRAHRSGTSDSERIFSHSPSPSSRMRLSLQTLFQPIHINRSSKSRSQRTAASTTDTTSPSSLRSSPSSTFSLSPRRMRAQMPPSTSPAPSATAASMNLRRQPSAIDLALEEEAHANPVQMMGLGLLEPRPRANTASSTSSGQLSWMEFMHETERKEVVLDGIMEVLERA